MRAFWAPATVSVECRVAEVGAVSGKKLPSAAVPCRVSGVTEQVRHLLVDGNNLGRAWPGIAAHWKRHPAVAQQRVVDAVRAWHDAMGWRVTVVFDGRGQALTIDHPTGEASLVVAFAPGGTTADTVIEQWVARSRDPADCVVATDDRALGDTVTAQGAGVVSSRDLLAWLARARESIRVRTVRREEPRVGAGWRRGNPR